MKKVIHLIMSPFQNLNGYNFKNVLFYLHVNCKIHDLLMRTLISVGWMNCRQLYKTMRVYKHICYCYYYGGQ